jgi:hypothetical protein
VTISWICIVTDKRKEEQRIFLAQSIEILEFLTISGTPIFGK